MCIWYYGCYPSWTRQWITSLGSNNRNRSCSVWEMKRLPGMRSALGAERSCWLEHVVAEQGRSAPAGSTALLRWGGAVIWCSKKNKKTTWLVATVTTIIAPSKGSVREIYIQWKVAMMFRCLRLLLCAYARGYALLHNTVIQPLFLVFFLNNPVKRQRGSVFIMAVC